jgi:hypothetical protein
MQVPGIANKIFLFEMLALYSFSGRIRPILDFFKKILEFSRPIRYIAIQYFISLECTQVETSKFPKLR